MPTTCIAIGCSNKGKMEGITYHSFPKNAEHRQNWINAVKRKDWEPKKHSRICSEHFQEADIDRTSLSCVRIRDGAVPVIFPPLSQESQELEDIKPLLDIKIEEDDPLSTPLSTGQQSDFDGVPCGLMDADTTIRHEHLNFMHERNKDEDHSDLWRASEQKKKREQNKLAQPMKTDKRHRKMPRGGSHEDSDNLISVVRDQYNEYGLQIAKTLRDIKNPVTFRRVVNRINKTLLDAVAGRCSKSSPENGVRSMNGSKASTDFPKVILPPVCKDEEEELSDAVDPLGSYSPNQQCKVAELSKVVRLITSHTD